MNENDIRKGFKVIEDQIKEQEQEKKNLIDGFWYEIDCPQCSPFLPFEIESIYPISEEEYIKQIAVNWK